MNKPPGPISEGLSLPEYLSHYGHRIVPTSHTLRAKLLIIK